VVAWPLVGGFGCGYFLSLGSLAPELPGLCSEAVYDRGGARLTERLSERFFESGSNALDSNECVRIRRLRDVT
jgi:hypothetical protein